MIASDNQNSYPMKCSLHEDYNSEYLHVFDKTGNPFCCIQCMRDKELGLNSVIHIQEIIKSSKENSRKILYNYPPINSPRIQQSIEVIENLTSKDDLYDQVEQYFNDLQSEFNLAIEKAKSQAKKKIIEVAAFKEEFFQKYAEISSILQINQLLVERKEGMQKKISDILQQKVAETDKYTQILSNLLLKNGSIDEGFSMIHPKEIEKNVIALLNRIDFFKGTRAQPQNQHLNEDDAQQAQQATSFFQKSNMIRSTQASSSALQISKNDQNHIVVKSPLPNAHKIAYSDFILDPAKRYIFRVHLSSFKSPNNFLVFGILDDNTKDSNQLCSQKMAYCERGNEYGMGQMIRGNALHSGNQQKVDRSFEMRVFLREKVLKVSDFPNYQNVCQLNDTSRINPSIQYRFGIQLCFENTMITITDILEVPEFDQRM